LCRSRSNLLKPVNGRKASRISDIAWQFLLRLWSGDVRRLRLVRRVAARRQVVQVAELVERHLAPPHALDGLRRMSKLAGERSRVGRRRLADLLGRVAQQARQVDAELGHSLQSVGLSQSTHSLGDGTIVRL